MTNVYGCDDIFNWAAGSAYNASYAIWLADMTKYLNLLKAAGGTNVNMLIYNDGSVMGPCNLPYTDQTTCENNGGVWTPGRAQGGFYTGNGDMASGHSSGHDVPGYDYGHLAIAFASLAHSLGFTVTIQAGGGDQTWLIASTDVQQAYITDLCQMVSDINPDIIDVLQEPSWDWDTTAYIAFLVSAATQIKAVKPSVRVGVFSNPWWDYNSTHDANHFLNQACSGSTGGWINLPADTIFVTHAGYYDYNNDYVPSESSYFSYYWNRSDYTTAKSILYSFLDNNCGLANAKVRGIYCIIENIGTNNQPRTGMCSNTTYNNDQTACVNNGGTWTPFPFLPDDGSDKIQFLTDITNYCLANGVGWDTSGSGGVSYGDPCSWVFGGSVAGDNLALNQFGQAIFANIVTIPSSSKDLSSSFTIQYPSITWDNYDWTVQEGSWSVASNILSGQNFTGDLSALVTAGNMAWSDYSVTMDTVITSGAGVNSTIVIRFVDGNNFYYLGLGSWGHEYSISKCVAGVYSEITSSGVSSSLQLNTSYKVKAVATGNTLQLYVNDSLVLTANDSSFSAGKMGVRAWDTAIQVLDLSTSAGVISYVYGKSVNSIAKMFGVAISAISKIFKVG